MKRIFLIMLIFLFIFCGCSGAMWQYDKDMYDLYKSLDDDDDNAGIVGDMDDDFFVAAWLSYFELMPKSFEMTRDEYAKQIEETLENLSKAKVENLFVHVRPFADAIYPSKYFPSAQCVASKQGQPLAFDFFQVIIEEAKKKNIKVHAWINPYRIQNNFDQSLLSDESIAKKWISQKSDNVLRAGDGLYFNPSSTAVRKLITDSVREILENYDVCGIHIDDYFYPTTDEAFDEKSYSLYREEGGKLSLSDWRRENVNSLLSMLYCTVKSFGEEKIFSVSPCGKIDKNENELYADVKLWCEKDGYCDMIIPQVYYGFENESAAFEETALSWKKLLKNNSKLCLGLALYKTGKVDEFALSGKDEWRENKDIIARQISFAKENGFDGISIYSASFVNFNEISSSEETQNLADVLSYIKTENLQ